MSVQLGIIALFPIALLFLAGGVAAMVGGICIGCIWVLHLSQTLIGLRASLETLLGGSFSDDRGNEITLLVQAFDRMSERLSLRTAEMIALQDMSERLLRCDDLTAALRVLKRSLRKLFPSDGGELWLYDNKSDQIVHAFSWGDVDGDSLTLAVEDKGMTFGLLHLHVSPSEPAFGARRALAETVARQSALVFANLQLRDHLRNQSVRDPLTGAFNRRYLEETLARELIGAQRESTHLGVIVLDMDHFKRFNDEFGHGAGDLLLCELVKAVRGVVRGSDVVCRYGGEEFVVVMPSATLEATRARAEQIRLATKRLQLDYVGRSIGEVSVSLGVAVYPEHGDSAEALIRGADEALYRAKRAGRDRVRTAGVDLEKAA